MNNSINNTIMSVVEDDLAIHDEFVQAVLEKGEPWTDQDFPPVESSIYRKKEDSHLFGGSEQAFFETLEWKRLNEVYPESPLFREGCFEPNDIIQGNIGNCYFLATLSSLAIDEGRRTRFFKTRATNA